MSADETFLRPNRPIAYSFIPRAAEPVNQRVAHMRADRRRQRLEAAERDCRTGSPARRAREAAAASRLGRLVAAEADVRASAGTSHASLVNRMGSLQERPTAPAPRRPAARASSKLPSPIGDFVAHYRSRPGT